jgi:hypothetical protein
MRPGRKLTLLLIPLVVLTVMFTPRLSYRAEAVTPMTEQQWQQLTKDKAFGYKDKKETHKPDREEESATMISNLIAAVLQFFSSSLGKAIVWSVFFLLLGYALIRIFLGTKTGLFRSTKKIQLEEEHEGVIEHEDLLEKDWEYPLQRAMKEGNTRLAIRYSYMLLLQVLQEHHFIHYRSDKTNYDYYNELSNKAYKLPFRQLTREYEYAWYGNYPVSPDSYNAYMNRFNHLKQQITGS